MNTYKCYWKTLQCEVESDSTFHAQQLAYPILQKMAGRKKVLRYDITVLLVAIDGISVPIDTRNT